MELRYRADWPEAEDRLTRWWEGEYLGRPAMAISAPAEAAVWEQLPEPPTLWDFWTNPDYVIPRTEQAMRNTAFLGEACPQAWVNLGPVSATGFLGTRVILHPTTVWHEPIIEDWEGFEVCFGRDNEWWQTTVKLTEALVQAAEGKWFVGTADVADVGDILAYLRGAQALCIDLVEGPRERMRQVRDQVLDLSLLFYEELTAIVNARAQGGASWLGVWSPKRTATLQCDFSCMVSPQTFDEFFAPTIARQALALDHVVYHLDGPDAIRHLDTLLGLPRLHMIQWVPGSGAESAAHARWRPLLRRIIEGGVKVHLGVAPDEVQGLLEDLPAESLYLQAHCATQAEAEDLLAAAQRWSRPAH